MSHALRTRRASRPGAAFLAKWPLFTVLERLSDLRGNETAGALELPLPPSPRPALWVFVSTIGELNAIDPYLRELAQQLATLQLVLITDHPHYRQAYESRYPNASVCVTLGHSQDAIALARHYPPSLLAVAEIPCRPSDAPCRFSVAFLLEAKRRQAPAVLINGWLYGYQPASRMDKIERNLFDRHYIGTFDVACVQSADVARRLIALGARPECTVVTGNLKFDAINRSAWTVDSARSPQTLGALLKADRPIVVAGCVTDLGEQNRILDAFVLLRQTHAEALLVIAPRHPEVAERMHTLRGLLQQRALPAIFRSQVADQAVPTMVSCLVLDTIGDLRDFYAAATVAHVGVDHNVLEPLAFDKPVTVSDGWEATFPSYPVYQLLHEQGALLEADDAESLAARWRMALRRDAETARHAAHARHVLSRASGALQRHRDAIGPWLELLR